MKKFCVFAVMLLLCCSFVFSLDYNVCIYPANDSIKNFIDSYFPVKEVNDSLLQFYSKVLYENSRKEAGLALHNAYEKDDSRLISKNRKSYDALTFVKPKDNYLNVCVTDLNSDYDVDSLLEGNIVFLRHICLENNIQLLLIPVQTNNGNICRTRLYAFDNTNAVFEKIFDTSSQFDFDIPYDSLCALSSYFYEDSYAFLKVVNIPDGADIKINNSKIRIIGSLIPVKCVPMTVEISCYGYLSKKEELNPANGDVIELDCSLEKKLYSGLTISSNPVSDVYLNSVYVGTTPFLLDEYSLPLNLSFSSKGYIKETFSLNSEKESWNINLRPQWMSDKNIYEEAKKEFYNSFARSILTFGLKALAGSVQTNDNVKNILNGVATGLLTVSITDTVRCLFNYYRYANYVSQ